MWVQSQVYIKCLEYFSNIQYSMVCFTSLCTNMRHNIICNVKTWCTWKALWDTCELPCVSGTWELLPACCRNCLNLNLPCTCSYTPADGDWVTIPPGAPVSTAHTAFGQLRSFQSITKIWRLNEGYKNNSQMPKINLNTDIISKLHHLKYGTHYGEMPNDSSTYHWFVM